MTTQTVAPVSTFELPPWATANEKRKGHIARVTSMLAGWADALDLSPEERRAWIDAGRFHDALKDAPDAELRALVGNVTYEPQMLHGPAAAARLEREGETRQGVLDAVRYHTIGYLDWDRTGRALYMADFLEPGRSFSQTQPRVSRGAGAARISTACSSKSCAPSSSGRCTRDIRCSPRPSRSGIRFDEASRSRRAVRSGARRDCGGRCRDARSRRDVTSSASANDRAPDSVRIRVQVLNGTTTRGLARRATMLLRDRGFDVVETGTISASRDTTIVLDLSGHPDWARRVARALGTGAHRSARRQLTLPGCRRRSWVDVAAAGRAVLPVAVRTPQRCRRRGSFAPPPRRRAFASSFANARMRSADDGVKPRAPPG